MMVPADPAHEAPGLKAGALGLVGLSALGAVMLSPALGMYGSWGPIASIAGLPTPLVFLAALAVSLPTAISYAVISREMPSAGSAFTWVWESTAPPIGALVGLVMAAFYAASVILQPIVFGLFFNDLLDILGIEPRGLWTWALGAALVTALVIVLTYRGIEIAARSALMFLLVEIAVVVALSATIVVTKIGDGDLTLAPFNPGEIDGGISTFWSAMLVGVFSYTGFDVISTAAEEAKAPRRLVPIATLLALVGVGIFFAVNSWAFSISEPVSKVRELTAAGLTPVTPIAEGYWGWGRVFVVLTALTAVTGVYVAVVVGASRALYAMGRQRMLPAALGSLHPRFRVPWNAMHVVFGLTVVGVFSVALALGNAFEAFVWWIGPVVFFALLTYLAVNVANIVYFTRFARDRFNWFLNGVVPLVGIGLDAYLIYRSFFKALWSAGFRTGQSVILVSMVVLALCLIYVVYLVLSRSERLSGTAFIVR